MPAGQRGIEIGIGHVRSEVQVAPVRRPIRSAISASANRPRIRSISRVPRCQQRNNSRLRRSSRPSLDRVDPVIVPIPIANAKSPDAVPGGVDITLGSGNVSSVVRRYPCENEGSGLQGNPQLPVIACDKREHLRAQSDSNPSRGKKESWIASWSLSSVARSRDPLAAMTTSADTPSRSRRLFRARFGLLVPPSPIRGRRECRASDAPDSRVCNG